MAASIRWLATIAHNGGVMDGNRAIGSWRQLLNHVMIKFASVISDHIPFPKTFAVRLRPAGKQHEAVITEVARKLVAIVSALNQAGRK
ncbi:hypothetical protein AAFO90_23420 [Phaeobacter sp. CAU 1743]